MRHETTFSDAFKNAEAALLKRKGMQGRKRKREAQVEIPEGVNAVDEEKLNAWVAEMVHKHSEVLRDDVNSVLDAFSQELDAREPMPLVVHNKAGELIGKMEGIRHEAFETLLRAVETRDSRGHRKNILLKGPMGSGKSTACKQIADLIGLDFSYTGQTLMPHTVEGGVNQVTDKFRTTPFVEAFSKSGLWVGEEVDGWSPNATLVLNPPLANGYLVTPDGKRHERHKDFVCIVCANTWGTGATNEYVGRNKLDNAFLDRFAYKIEWGYDEVLERKAANDDEVVDAVQLARYNAEKAGLKIVISPRASIDIADMVRAGFSMREAMDMNFLAGLDRDQRTIVLDGVTF